MTNWYLSIVTPSSGNTFGWRRAFHLITSLQNLWMGRGQLTNRHAQNDIRSAHLSNLIKITLRAYPQDLGCDAPTLIISHPHVCEPASVLRDFQSVVAKWDLERSWEQSPATAYMTQSAQTLSPEPWWEAGEIQSLIGEGGGSKAKEPKRIRTIRRRLGSEEM